jgi:hypothetical protein
MPSTERRHTFDELESLATTIYDSRIKSGLQPEDDGKFVAIDVESGEYEIDEDDYNAVMRLRSRQPVAEIWLARVGAPTTCRIGVVR